jgi:hypothetical protein
MQDLEVIRQRILRIRVRSEVALLAGEQKSTLSRFSILQGRKQSFETPEHLNALREVSAGGHRLLQRLVGQQRDDHHREHGQQKSDQRFRGQRQAAALDANRIL